jgi:L-lactate dehydrogenase (cytochrome)
MRLEYVVNVDEFRSIARRRLPRMIFDFVDGGAEDELTLRANARAFDRISFRPSALVDVRKRSIETAFCGIGSSMPIVVGPAGLTRIVHPGGELAVSAAASSNGVPYVVTPWSSYTMEELAKVSVPELLWFEVHPMSDADLRGSLIKRAAANGFGALVYLVDSALSGRRERELKRGISFPPRYSVRNVLDAARRPRWSLGYVRNAHKMVARNIQEEARRSLFPKVPPLADVGKRIASTRGTWEDLAEVRGQWSSPLAVKGIMSRQDAVRAVDAGADMIIVSNHGGRQLDGLPSTIDVLPEIVDAVGSSVTVLVDGGVRRGTHVAKAMALGAKGCLIGRPYHYGLAAAGESGVQRVLELFATELSLTLGLLGLTDIDQLDLNCVRIAG